MTKQLYRDQVEMHLNAFNGGLIKNRREDDIVDTFFQQRSGAIEAARRILEKEGLTALRTYAKTQPFKPLESAP